MTMSDGVLPIEMTQGFALDAQQARDIGSLLAEDYAQAQPFPHAVIDNIFPTAFTQLLLDHFPQDPKAHDKVYEKGYGGTHKRQISPYDCDDTMRAAFALFNSAPMLQFIEALTGMKGLLPDPYFAGGGLHETSAGGLLGIHADFQVNESLQLYRRVNMLVYLNQDWQPEYGGNLELWDRQMQARQQTVAPLFNRCVIFNTDADSFHGHPDPLTTPEGVTRRSIALYYYQALPIPNEQGESRHTLYVARPHDDAETKSQVKKMMKKRDKRAKKMFAAQAGWLQQVQQWWKSR
jgi:hypothetical protein